MAKPVFVSARSSVHDYTMTWSVYYSGVAAAIWLQYAARTCLSKLFWLHNIRTLSLVARLAWKGVYFEVSSAPVHFIYRSLKVPVIELMSFSQWSCIILNLKVYSVVQTRQN